MPLNIQTAKRPHPPRVWLYGPGKIGKTTLASRFPGVLLLPVEEGAEALDVPRLPQPTTWAEALASLDQVAAEPSGFTAFAVDSVTALESLCQAQVAAENKAKTCAEVAYGKGYAAVAVEWRRFLDKLSAIRAKGLAIILIGHQEVVRYDDPKSAGYDRLQPRLHKSIMAATFEFCDIVLCAQYRVYTSTDDRGFGKERTRAIGGGDRVLYAQEQPTHLAGNRYGIAAELPFSWDPILAGVAAAFASPPEVGDVIHAGRESVITAGAI